MAEWINPEWRDGNEPIRYPWHDTATLINAGGVTLTPDVFIDARIYVIGGTLDTYLRSIVVSDDTLTFNIGDPTNGDTCSGTFSLNSPPTELALFDTRGRPAGVLVTTPAKLTALAAQFGAGTVSFEFDETKFCPDVIIPMPQVGVRGFILDDGGVVADDIYLVGADGIVLSAEDGTIRIDAIGDPYALLKACEDEGVETPIFCGLKTINLIPPAANGDFGLAPGANSTGDPTVRVVAREGVIQIGAAGVRTGLNNG